MNYKVTTTLKKADTDGRIPAYTLDQYVRTELSRQLIDALKSSLTIERLDVANTVSQTHVDFSTEVVLLQPQQWQTLRKLLTETIHSLSPDQQQVIQQLIAGVEPTK